MLQSSGCHRLSGFWYFILFSSCYSDRLWWYFMLLFFLQCWAWNTEPQVYQEAIPSALSWCFKICISLETNKVKHYSIYIFGCPLWLLKLFDLFFSIESSIFSCIIYT
jgi:hypothetical protein